MRTITPAPLALVTLLVSIGACSKSANDSATALATSASAASAASPSAASAPRMAEYNAPPAERLGVLAPNTGIPVGQKVPDVSGRDLDGKDIALSSLYRKGPILLASYRGGWCPYCNAEIHALTTAFPEYQKRGVTPVAVSVDTPENGTKMKATYTIPFPVISDSDAVILEAFHVVKQLTPDEYAKYKSYGEDLESYSGTTHHKIAIPALFLIDRGGVVRWAHSDPAYNVRPSTAQILAAIDATPLK
jgi:peroxiredoxin